MNDPILDDKAREAVHAAKNAAQAVEMARKSQLDEAALVAAHLAAELAAERIAGKLADKDEMRTMMNEAVKKGFSFGEHDEKRFIDITQVKLICQSIFGIDKRLTGIETNITWGVRIIIGAVLAALLSLVIMR